MNFLRKIRIITNCTVCPFSLFVAALSMGKFGFFAYVYKGFLGLILPATFIFDSVLSEMFESMIFLSSVRPFDAGDFVMIDNKAYEVYELGLLYTTILYENKTTEMLNEKLRTLTIYNLRNARYMTHKMQIFCKYSNYVNSIDNVKKIAKI